MLACCRHAAHAAAVFGDGSRLSEPVLPRAGQARRQSGTVDAASLVTSEARLIVSDAVLQAAVKAPSGCIRKPGTADARSWASAALDWIRGHGSFRKPATISPFDRRVALLRNRVEVVRGHALIPHRAFPSLHVSADEAAAVVNAIALQYVQGQGD